MYKSHGRTKTLVKDNWICKIERPRWFFPPASLEAILLIFPVMVRFHSPKGPYRPLEDQLALACLHSNCDMSMSHSTICNFCWFLSLVLGIFSPFSYHAQQFLIISSVRCTSGFCLQPSQNSVKYWGKTSNYLPLYNNLMFTPLLSAQQARDPNWTPDVTVR